MNNKYKGSTVSSGIAIGPARVIRKSEPGEPAPVTMLSEPDRVEAELVRLEQAIEATKIHMDKMVLDAGVKAGKDAAQIFLMHKLVLDGKEFRHLSRICIEDGQMDAEEAVRQTSEALASKFDEMEDEYMRARADDVRDIAREVITALREGFDKNDDPQKEYPHILVTRSILPGEVMELDQDNVLAIVTVEGSTTSHAAVLAHMMDIPMIVSVPIDLDAIEDGTPIYVNADAGEVIVSPDVDFIEQAHQSSDPVRSALLGLRGCETVTITGRHIDLYANISSVVDMKKAMENDAEGIGLYRSEFMYMERLEAPSEDEQFAVYKKLLGMYRDKVLTVRTLDVGGDKLIPYLDTGEKRGLSVSLDHPDIFRVQLRALVRASVYGQLRIMYPYVTNAEEVVKANSLFAEVKWALLSEVGSVSIPQGIMVETVNAAENIDSLIPHADFISIGTNDLACDVYGTNRFSAVDEIIDDDYENLFAVIGRVAYKAHSAGLSVCVCGEIASRREYTSRLLDTGVDCLSVAPAEILIMRDHINNNCR